MTSDIQSVKVAKITLADILNQCEGQLLPLPSDGTGASGEEQNVFSEPWQAQAFAMTIQLHAAKVFTWAEWASALTQEIKEAQNAGDPDTGATYYHHWINALEKLILQKNIGTAEQIHDLEHAWEDAAARTPHGQPIEL
jgi:nitrile hydratase accessory protein